MLELMDKLPWDSYRIEAIITDEGPHSTDVGIYFCHTQETVEIGLENWFLTLSFAEHDRFPPPSPGSKNTTDAALNCRWVRLNAK